MKRAIGYCRVSTHDQATEGVSLEAQQARIEAWCKANNYELANLYTDAGISGSKMKNRPALQEALEALQKGDALVFYSLSRLARSTVDLYRISESLSGKKIDMVSMSEQIDTTTAAGRLMFGMLSVMAQFERDLISERTRDALAHKKATGQVYGTVPYGYQEQNGLLVQHDQEGRVVMSILKRRKKGHSFRAIASHLNDQGIPTKTGKRWEAATVHYICKRVAV